MFLFFHADWGFIRAFTLPSICRTICTIACRLVNFVPLFDMFVFLPFTHKAEPATWDLINEFVGSSVGNTSSLPSTFTDVTIGLEADEDRIRFGDGNV